MRGSAIIRDLRIFIKELESRGDLLRVKDTVDWRYEIGERTRRAQLTNGPALLFETIRDYPLWRMFTNGLGRFSRIATAFDFPPSTSFTQLTAALKRRLRHPTSPSCVDTAPVYDNFLIGKEVNLFNLPVPWWNRKDGGRYIGTWHLNATKDPETSVRNIGVYRMQVAGPRNVSVSFSKRSHFAIHLAKAEAKRVPLDMAVAIGADERQVFAAAASPPYGVDEYALAGSLMGHSVELIKCRTVSLELPASSEIVLEGEVIPGLRVKEGPFFDYSGVPRADHAACVFDVKALAYRSNPIFRGAAIGYPGAEDHLLFSLLSSLNLLDFHGSVVKQKIQAFLVRNRRFRTFQFAGSLRRPL